MTAKNLHANSWAWETIRLGGTAYLLLQQETCNAGVARVSISRDMNDGGDALGFTHPDGSIVAVIMYNSGGASNCIMQIAGNKLQFAMTANGWATVIAR